jgi:hypothetical protein
VTVVAVQHLLKQVHEQQETEMRDKSKHCINRYVLLILKQIER